MSSVNGNGYSVLLRQRLLPRMPYNKQYFLRFVLRFIKVSLLLNFAVFTDYNKYSDVFEKLLFSIGFDWEIFEEKIILIISHYLVISLG